MKIFEPHSEKPRLQGSPTSEYKDQSARLLCTIGSINFDPLHES